MTICKKGDANCQQMPSLQVRYGDKHPFIPKLPLYAAIVYLYYRLKLQRPSGHWPAQLTIEITNEDKVGRLNQVQKVALLIMQFVLWRGRCAWCFTDSSKNQDGLMEEILWQLRFYKHIIEGVLNRCMTAAYQRQNRWTVGGLAETVLLVPVPVPVMVQVHGTGTYSITGKNRILVSCEQGQTDAGPVQSK